MTQEQLILSAQQWGRYNSPMYEPFTKRGKPPPPIVTDTIPELVRNRLLAVLKELTGGWGDPLRELFYSAAKTSEFLHGSLSKRRQYHRNPNNPLTEIEDHFFACDADEFLEFIELVLQNDMLHVPTAIQLFNGILRQEGVGYRFTDRIVNRVPGSTEGSIQHEVTPSIAVLTTEESTYQQTIEPALRALGNPLFKAASDELLDAHKHFRDGNWSDAITNAGKSLESVLKVICEKKKWKYNPDADVLSRLVDTCNQNGLFPSFYVEIFKNAGTIRNKLGAHGKANKSHAPAGEAMADHMIQLVSSHILLLIKLAKL
jgi:AbiJ N-terminal domain 4